MYLWVLALATKSEPTLIGQLALSLRRISILDVASSSIALWSARVIIILIEFNTVTKSSLKLFQ